MIMKRKVPGTETDSPGTTETPQDVSKNSTSDIVSQNTSDGKRKRTPGQQRAAARKRNFATVVYPDSAPDDWREQLSAAHVAAFISPLHDQDVNPDGTQKKPHWHVLLMYESPQDFESAVLPLFEKIGGVGRETVNSLRGYARYLCHLDNPEKHQYDTAGVVQMGGADYSAAIHLASDDQAMLMDIMAFVRVNQIYSLAELMDITAACNQDWYNMVTMSRTYTIGEYIKALMWEENSGYVRLADRGGKLMDPKTGEVMEVQHEDD